MKVVLVGCGNMGRALIHGALAQGVWQPGEIIAYDIQPQAVERLVQETGCLAAASLQEALLAAELLIVATKPGDVAGLLSELALLAGGSQLPLVLSLAAGVPIAAMEDLLGPECRIIRAMPNTPVLVGAGATALAGNLAVSTADWQLAEALFAAVGIVVGPLKEELLDVVTGLSGSGPAYAYLIIEALADAGVSGGLSRADAQQLAAQTLFGAAKMVLTTGVHPAVLRDQVSSPSGTTIRGLSVLEQHGVRAGLQAAVMAASARARELRGG